MVRFSLKADELLGSREIRFLNRQEYTYPHLMRLCLDFDLKVLQLQRRTFSHISLRQVPTAPEFILGSCENPSADFLPMTPRFPSLQELEAYVMERHVDILHEYLFESTQKMVGMR